MSAIRLLPWRLHEAVEYLAGIFLVLAPLILGFTGSPAVPVFLGAGIALLVLAGLSRGELGVVEVLPPAVHAVVDYLLGFFLILSPFAFGFSADEPALYTAMLLGVAHLVITLVTRFPPAEGAADEPRA